MVAGRRYFTDAAAALSFDASLYAGGLPPEQQATLILFSDWFKATFPRVEAVREAKRQVEFDFGQTQSLEHHNADFNELLDKLPGTSTVLLGEPTHIDHYLSSLSELLPAELAADYDAPRKVVEDEHATTRDRSRICYPAGSAGGSSGSREECGSCWQEAGLAPALD